MTKNRILAGLAKPRDWRWPLALGAVLLGALALRWPPPDWSHFDEVAFVVIPLGFWSGDLNPHFFNYPTFHFYLCSLVYYLKYLVAGAGSAEQFAAQGYFLQSGDLLALARGLQVGFSLGAVWLTAALGRRLYAFSGGLVAGLLMALMPLNVRFAPIAGTDGPAAFWALLAVFIAVRLLQEGRPWDLVWAGLAAGLAGATKYPAGLALVPVMAAGVLRQPTRRALWRAVAAAGLAFALASPYVWLDPQGFWRDFSQMGRDHLLNSRLEEPAWFFSLRHSLRYGMGILVLLAAGLALALRPRHWRAEEVVIGIAALALAVPLLVGASGFMRYALPLAPLLALLAARTLSARPAMLWVLTALVAAEPLYLSLRTRQLWSGPDTRALGAQWLTSHYPAGGRLLSLPSPCGALEVLTPRQVLIRQTHFLRSFGPEALRRVYLGLAGQEKLPPLYLELGGELEVLRQRPTPAAGDSLAEAVLVWARHPVCGEGGLGEEDSLLGSVGWQLELSPGNPEGAAWDLMDWYFLPVGGFGRVAATGPELRLGVLPWPGGGKQVEAGELFAALAAVLDGHRALEEERWQDAVWAYKLALGAAVAAEELLGPATARQVLSQLARAELGQGHTTEAVRALEEAVGLVPAGPELYNDLGIARAAAGQLPAAMAAWEEGIARYPQFAPLHFNLGRALAETGRFDRAEDYWRRGLELMPDHPMAGKIRAAIDKK
ncbi:MAG: tetratricopeptide repeat protein [Armatimonadetes bacterium]|nr:tetratricopeptide repeat protein [Armatimonadota bacterium]